MKKSVEIQFRMPDDGPEVMINEFGVTIWADGQSVHMEWTHWLDAIKASDQYQAAVHQINGGK